MPELPEVETVVRSLAPALQGKTVARVNVYSPKLRENIPNLDHLVGQTVLSVERRSKYILIKMTQGMLIVHLGMTGVLTWARDDASLGKHDHMDIWWNDTDWRLRYSDPRRFGLILWYPDNTWVSSKWIKDLGPEPLDNWPAQDFAQSLSQRSTSIKQAIMDNHVVVGVGNIYANEALFESGIHPLQSAKDLTKPAVVRLHHAIQNVLQRGIIHKGASIRNYRHTDGGEGNMSMHMHVYGKNAQPCDVCGNPIQSQMVGGRNTFWCPKCQPKRRLRTSNQEARVSLEPKSKNGKAGKKSSKSKGG